ncbi:helix-turn-helix domain-containing protein [Limisalsivibrio acetivorans]|uniref:helix-turn-helix domain-containing protein n=1 Tax=Limisalsivibrio acetivorans TaxID=1304888 RepID=UPI0003B742C3|nr:helix-turn-helix transcriptional regulator [Limisalsivibrio acetivorans]
MELSDRLKQLRKHFKVSQAEIGRILDVGQQAVSHYESKGSIEASRLEILADHFSVDIKYFYEDGPISDYLGNSKGSLMPMGGMNIPVPAGWEELLIRISAMNYNDIKRIEKVLESLVEVFEEGKRQSPKP